MRATAQQLLKTFLAFQPSPAWLVSCMSVDSLIQKQEKRRGCSSNLEETLVCWRNLHRPAVTRCLRTCSRVVCDPSPSLVPFKRLIKKQKVLNDTLFLRLFAGAADSRWGALQHQHLPGQSLSLLSLFPSPVGSRDPILNLNL